MALMNQATMKLIDNGRATKCNTCSHSVTFYEVLVKYTIAKNESNHWPNTLGCREQRTETIHVLERKRSIAHAQCMKNGQSLPTNCKEFYPYIMSELIPC